MNSDVLEMMRKNSSLSGPWQHLSLFFAYRLLVAVILMSLFFSDLGGGVLGHRSPALFSFVSISYVGFIAASGLLLHWRSPNASSQAFMMVLVDIAAITLILHASGGVETGLGMLLAVSIAAGSLIIRGPVSLLLAALATLAILSEQLLLQIVADDGLTAYPQAGLLGASFFAIAILAHVLSQRLSVSERLVSQHKLDLADMAQLNEYVIQHMQTGIIVVDEKENIRLLNTSAWHLLGMPDARPGTSLEQTCQALTIRLSGWREDPDFVINPFRPVAGGKELKAGFSRLGQEQDTGTVIFLEDAAFLTQQAQQMKLASLGRLTASIAHEIRNPLGAISHAEQLLRESPDLPHADQRLIDIISTNSKRVNEIIESILQLSRRERSRPREFVLKTWLEELLDEFRRIQGLSSENLLLQIEPADTRIFADPTQLRQLFINLCENAVHHFNRRKSELRLLINGGITQSAGGPYTDLIDNGPGIRPEIARQIFEPFFTTENTGTGLGLYIAKELSESNRMRLEYFPVATGGSCFRMTFPGANITGGMQ